MLSLISRLPTVSQLCHEKPKYPGHPYCGRTCASKVATMCNVSSFHNQWSIKLTNLCSIVISSPSMASILIVQGRAQCSPERQPSLKTVCWINPVAVIPCRIWSAHLPRLDMLSYRSCLLMYLYISSTPSDLNGLLKSIYPEFLCPPSGRQRSPDMISNKIYIMMLRLLRSEAQAKS